MAIATSAAIGLGISAASAGASFAQAAKQNKLGNQARQAAAKAVAEGRKRLEVNFSKQLGIQKDPFLMAAEGILSSGAQAIEAGRESERGAAATAGRVVAGVTDAQRQIAGQMGQQMMAIDQLVAQEDAANRNAMVNLDIQEAQGANQEAINRENFANKAMQQGLAGVASVAGQVASAVPLFGKNKAAQGLIENLGGEERARQSLSTLGNFNGYDFSKVAKMDQGQFRDFIGQLPKSIFGQIETALPQKMADYASTLYRNPNFLPGTNSGGVFKPSSVTGLGAYDWANPFTGI